MAIDAKCPACDRTLRVSDENAGKQARCPACNAIYVVPGGETATRQSSSSDSGDAWYVKTPEGQVFGPVSQSKLDRWLAEGRIIAECELRTREDREWRPAGEFFGILGAKPRPSTGQQQPPAAETNVRTSGRSPYRRGTPSGRAMRQPGQEPHRGGTILAFGILGLVFGCPVFAVVAWNMGTTDLLEMQSGRMDASGRGLTQAGRVLGMVCTLVWLIPFILLILLVLVSLVARVFQ